MRNLVIMNPQKYLKIVVVWERKWAQRGKTRLIDDYRVRPGVTSGAGYIMEQELSIKRKNYEIPYVVPDD